MLHLHVDIRMGIGEVECILGIVCREWSRTIHFGLDGVWVKASLLPGFVTSDGLVNVPMPVAASLKRE